MVVGNKEALERLHSSDNLMNRLKSRRDAMGLFGVAGNTNVASTSIVVQPLAALTVPAPDFNPFAKSTKPESTAIATRVESPSTVAPATADNPNLDNLVNNADTQIKLATAHDKALSTLVSAIETLSTKMDDIKPEKLPGVITATSKVVDQIQRQRIDANKSRDGQAVHLHFYTPVQRKTEEYEVIDVG